MADLQEKPKVNFEEVLKTKFKAFLDSYADISSTKPSSFVMWNDAGKVGAYTPAICHAPMVYGYGNYSQMITAAVIPDQTSLNYLRMLLSGPFKAFAYAVSLEKEGDKYFFHIPDLSQWPANAIYNFCIATRVPIEHNHLLPRWSKLLDKGFEPTLAFLLSASTNGEAFNKDDGRDFINRNHFWFDCTADWRRVLSGDPTNLSRNYRDYPKEARPTNKIWGHFDNYGKLAKMSDEEIADFFKVPIIAPKPKRQARGDSKRNYDELLKIINGIPKQHFAVNPADIVFGQAAGAAAPPEPFPEVAPEPQPEIVDDFDFLEDDDEV